MKKLRFFDSLKLVLATVACVFILNVAHADDTNCANYIDYTSATGTVSQNGTPTPTNPIEPVFYTQGKMVLRAVGDVADSYDATTGKITRRVGVKVLDGTEDWRWGLPLTGMFCDRSIAEPTTDRSVLCNQFRTQSTVPVSRDGYCVKSAEGNIGIGYNALNGDVTAFKAYLAQQYNAGTPVIVVYPLATPVTEDWPSRQCEYIKIATTKYNEESFAPVKTDLSAAVNAVEYVVSNTMTQAQAIDTIATTKQTRPDEGCPAKYCLLVEDEDGTPHWYPIAGANGVAHNLPNGYTELQYLESNTTGTYIDTGFRFLTTDTLEADLMVTDATATKHMISVANNPGSNFFQIAQTDSLLLADFGTPATGRVSTSTISSVNNKVHLKAVGTGEFYVNDNLVGTATGNDFVGSGSIGLRLFGNSGEKGIRIYSFKILGKVNFIPARRNSDGVLGMYDLMDSNPATAFHTNRGTGTFVAGPDM